MKEDRWKKVYFLKSIFFYLKGRKPAPRVSGESCGVNHFLIVRQPKPRWSEAESRLRLRNSMIENTSKSCIIIKKYLIVAGKFEFGGLKYGNTDQRSQK